MKSRSTGLIGFTTLLGAYFLLLYKTHLFSKEPFWMTLFSLCIFLSTAVIFLNFKEYEDREKKHESEIERKEKEVVNLKDILDEMHHLHREKIDKFEVTIAEIETESKEALAEKEEAYTEQALLLAKTLFESGKDLNLIIDSLLDHFRDYLQQAFESKGPYKKEEVLHILDLLLVWQQKAAKTPFKQIHLEMLFITLVRNQTKLSLNTLIERLLELEGRLKTNATPPPVPIVKAPPPVEQVIEKSEPATPIVLTPKEEPKSLPKEEAVHPSKYDTLLQFAAIELEGTINQG